MSDPSSQSMGKWPVAVAALRNQSSVDEVLAVYESGVVTSQEVFGTLLDYCLHNPAIAPEVVMALRRHPSDIACRLGDELGELLRRRAEQVMDVELVRQTSALIPGTRLTLSGGYESFGPHWWLAGLDRYEATFLRFMARDPGKTPVALVVLDNEIDLTEASGRRHKGRYALLRLLYVVNWSKSETVTVHVVSAPPSDAEAFYTSHPFGTEIETHATYTNQSADGDFVRSMRADAEPTPTPGGDD